MAHLRDVLEARQVGLYFAAMLVGALAATALPGTMRLEAALTPALAVMLFATFLQVPLSELGRSFAHRRFLLALGVANFVLVPLLVAALLQLVPDEPLVRLGVLLVLLSPCIDYVVTFAHLGRADARALLAATPLLLVAQMALLPVYLSLFLGRAAGDLIQAAPFLHAFVWLIAVPLALAGALQTVAARHTGTANVTAGLGLLPVPATALVLFVVVASVVPQLGAAGAASLRVVPVYLAFALVAPVLGWLVGRRSCLTAAEARAVAFSAATRNSLVILPLALAIPGAMPLLPAIIVAQTLVELASELIYIRFFPRLGRDLDPPDERP
ncbi:arsenic resistance protein [Aquabacter sp. L1I39]|uniref:arsenic resistance protein n=1 Tax=Aquabacter sp. L1I39 TaxID=2820278 RepID=UPI001ADACF4B|nr:arsenic resistance protein [Aquabacter sp. L1I39]QTL04705.1 arsenic resistance protein [Aquabacter sp. L1I39]